MSAKFPPSAIRQNIELRTFTIFLLSHAAVLSIHKCIELTITYRNESDFIEHSGFYETLLLVVIREPLKIPKRGFDSPASRPNRSHVYMFRWLS